jgi:two-component system sporulation sensor kinase B
LAIPLALWFLAPRYRGWTGRKKWLFILQFSLFSSLFLVFVMIRSQLGVTAGAAQSMAFFWTYVLLHLGTTLLLVLLIEGFLKGSSLRAELFRSEKLNILSELAASVAHEIRNPMTTARGFMQLLKEQSSPDVFKKQMYCDMVIQELDRAQAVINDYMSLAKPHMEKMEVLELGEQAALLADMLSPFAMIRNVEMEKDLPPAMVTIYANPEKFNQCMVNLMKNGIESMEQGGQLRIAIGTAGDMAVIDVIDNGVGMTEMEVKRLGEPFYSTKQKGTGLGMMLCFRIIDSLGGKIEITSKKGKGTHCRVLIPLYKT